MAGRQGLIILPDDWTIPSGLSFVAGSAATSYSVNTYGVDAWKKMELAGAVFLPAAGLRGYATDQANEVSDIGVAGLYWTTTSATDDASSAQDFAFDGHGFGSRSHPRSCGMSVRPVTE